MSGFNDQTASDNPEIFFRAADRLQIESYLTALRQDNKSLILLSKHKALLSYYGELVVQRIYRAFPQTSLDLTRKQAPFSFQRREKQLPRLDQPSMATKKGVVSIAIATSTLLVVLQSLPRLITFSLMYFNAKV
jgi:hypothetical protein